MKRTLLLLATVLVLSSVQAHYYGFGGTVLASLDEGNGYLLGLQLGGPVGAGLELRGTLDTAFVTSNLGFDLLYPFALSAVTRGYAGGGADFCTNYSSLPSPLLGLPAARLDFTAQWGSSTALRR